MIFYSPKVLILQCFLYENLTYCPYFFSNMEPPECMTILHSLAEEGKWIFLYITFELFIMN